MAGNIKGIIVEIGGDTSGLQKALSKVNSATSSLSKELRGINSLLKLDPSNTILLAQKQQVLADSIENTEKKLKELKNTQKEADNIINNGGKISQENYRSLQREIINTEEKLKKLKVEASNWTKVGRSIEEVGTKITNISKKVENLGNTITTTLTLPILAVGTAAVSTGNNFEAQMSRVQAIAGATKDELEKLTNQAIQLGSETSFSASEVAEGMENLASAGFTTEEIMSAMPGLLDLAASSGADLATASEIAASAIRGFGLEAEEAGHVADVFAEAAARTNAQTEDMGYAMKYIAPVANTMGLKIEEVAAAIGIMSDAGIKGEQAGTTLRGALVRLTKPTDKMLDVMEELGISFYDNEGKMKSLTEMISMLQEATKSLTDEEQQYALTTLFGTESLSGMVALINRGSDDLKDMTKEFEDADGAAEEMADTMLDNTAGALESLSGSLESAGIAIQRALAPEIKDLAKWIQGLVDDFTNLSQEEQQNIIKTVALVAAIGPAIKILSKLGTGVGTVVKGLGTLSQALSVVRNNTVSTSSSVNNLAGFLKMIKSPAGIFTLAIGGTIAAIVALENATYKNNIEIQNSAKELENAKNKYNELAQAQQELLNTNLSELDNVQKLTEELKKLVNENGKVKEGYEDRVSFILNELNTALGTEYKITGNIIDKYGELVKTIDTVIEKQRASAILENEEVLYKEAIEKKSEAYDTMIDKEEELSKAKEDLIKKQKEYNDYQESYFSKIAPNLKTGYETELRQQENIIKQAEENLQESKNIYQNYLNDIANYENDYAIVTSGNSEKIKEMINSRTYTYQQSSDDIGEAINRNISQIQYEVEQYQIARQKDLENQDQMNAQKNQIQINAGNQQLMNLAEQLAKMTSTTEEMTPQQIEAWKNLAQKSYGIYSEIVSEMSPEMQKKIQETTGVIAAGTPQMQEQAGDMARKTIDEFDRNADAREKALNTMEGYLSGLSDEEKKELLKNAGIEDIDIVLKELDRGDLSEENGKNILEGLWKGLSNNTWQGRILNAAAGLVSAVNNKFTGKSGWDEHSPSKKMRKFAEYYIQPISEVMKERKSKITGEAEKLSQSINDVFNNTLSVKDDILKAERMQAKISREVIESSKTIFTTPVITFNVKELNKENLEQCFSYINKKFGSQY